MTTPANDDPSLMTTRGHLLKLEAVALTEAFGWQHEDQTASRFFSNFWTSPSGRTAQPPVTRRHFLAVPCISITAVGRMAACLSSVDPNDVIHHQEGHCPYRQYYEITPNA